MGECSWGTDKTTAEKKLEALTEEAQQHCKQLDQQMAGGRSEWGCRALCSVGLHCTAWIAVCLCERVHSRRRQSTAARAADSRCL